MQESKIKEETKKLNMADDPFCRDTKRELSKEEEKVWKKRRKKILKRVKKHDNIGAVWFDEDQKRITQESIFQYMNFLFKEEDQHSGNKYYFQIEMMFKLSCQDRDIKELKERVAELEKRLPLSS